MANRKIKCKGCGEMIDSSLAIVISGEKFCSSCAPARLKEARARTAINDIILKIADGNKDYFPILNREINALISKNNWKATGILATLEYIMTLEHPPTLDPEKGLTWVLERYYPIARKYYIELKELKNKFPDDEVKRILNQPIKEVTIRRSDWIEQQEMWLQQERCRIYGGPLIDLNELPDDEEEENDEN